MTLFTADRTKLYPQFETYRLHSLSPDEDVKAYPLPGPGATQSRLEYAHHNLSFKETRARIAWDHLSVDQYGRGVYVDKEWKVWGFVLAEELQPLFIELAELPTPISGASASSSTSPAPEYPSALPVSETRWLINTGSGSVYVLDTSRPGEAFTGTMSDPVDLGQPYLLQAARLDGHVIRMLVSRSILEGRKQTAFELAEFSLTQDGVLVQEWSMSGADLPISCSWHQDGWTILSSEHFAAEPSLDAAADTEGASTPGGIVDTPLERPTIPPTQSEPPFSWTQTGEAASVRFTLAPGTQRSDLSFSLSTTSFKLASRVPQSPALSRLMSVGEHTWWAPIDLDASSLTYDPVKAILEVEIEKEDSPNRWPSLFLPNDDVGIEDGEFDVPEKLDPSLLAAVKATFDSIKPKGDGPDEPQGNHPAIPSLLREEMDFDMEDGEDFDDRAAGALGEQGGKVGREVFVGRIRNGIAEWSRTTSDVVSLPFDQYIEHSLVVKSAVDGLIFTPPANDLSPAKKPWTHGATVPALAFVLSSKRDIRLVRHLPVGRSDEYVIMAFDAGGADAGQGNVYVYYPPSSKTEAKQGVVRVSGGDRGAMLGLGMVPVGREGRKVVVALCERALVVLHDVL